jgi:hypothetical protein
VTAFFLDSDDDGHWFLIQANKRKEWEKWREDVYTVDDFDITPPDYAEEIGGHPNMVEFINPTTTSSV